MESHANPWDEYAAEYGQFIARREQADLERDTILCRMLDLLGDLTGRDVLDAGCGEGFLARVLAVLDARVTGLDLSPRLVQMAREKDPHGAIDYHVADLSRPLPEWAEHIEDYFAHGAMGIYRGMSAQGVKAHYYHRTLEEYLDAFLSTGLRLAKLVDVPEPERPGQRRFPLFMVLAYDKP